MYMFKLRQRIAVCLDVHRPHDSLSLMVDVFLIGLITLNVIAIIAESVPSIASVYQPAFQSFELFSVAVFTVEYCLRLWSCPDSTDGSYAGSFTGRVKFALTPGALIDLLAILPFYLGFLIGMDLRFLRVIRLLRVFKLTRYSATVQMIVSVFKSEASAFIAAFALLLVLLILASSGIYLIEQDVQPEVFGSIPAAMWWAMATLTTVGYGDAIPITPMGKFFGGCITLIGVGMVALPAGILASSFSEQLRRQREQYGDSLASALEDGVVTEDERHTLEKLQTRLGITDEDAQLLLRAQQREHPECCPHCSQPLHATNSTGSQPPGGQPAAAH